MLAYIADISLYDYDRDQNLATLILNTTND